MEQYSTNLTDKQWQFIEKIVNTQKRRRKYSVVKLLYISYRYLIFQFFISLFPQLITVKNILPNDMIRMIGKAPKCSPVNMLATRLTGRIAS